MRAGSRFNEARKLGPVDMICGGVFDTKMRLQFLDLVAPRKVGNLAVSDMVYIVLVTLQVTSAMAPERMSTCLHLSGKRAARTYDVCDVVHFAMHVLGVTTARCVRIVREFVVSYMLHGWRDLLLGRRLSAIWYYSRHCISLRRRRGRCCGSVTNLTLAACKELSNTIDL